MSIEPIDLYQIKRIRHLIDAKLEEYERVMALGTRITPILSDMPKGISDNNTSRVESTAIKLADLLESIELEYRALLDLYNKAHAIIEDIDNPIYQAILTDYFLNNMTLEQVADRTHYTTRTVYRKIKEAKKEYYICEKKIFENINNNA